MGIKKTLATIMMACLSFGSVSVAQSAEFKFSGIFIVASEYQKNPNFVKGDAFDGLIRFRPRLDAIISENLYSSLQLELGTYKFGYGPTGIGSRNNSNVKVRQMYIASKMPGMENLSMTLGIQYMTAPSATFGNYVLDDNVAGVSFGYTINEMVSFNLAWSRPYATVGGQNDKGSSAIDYVQVDVPVSFSGVTISPWAAFANITRKSGSSLAQATKDGATYNFSNSGTNAFLAQEGLMNAAKTWDTNGNYSYVIPNVAGVAWWVGAAVEIEAIKNLHIGIDGVYGQAKFGSNKAASREGFMIGLDVNYKLPMFTPAIKYWYASGNKKNSGLNQAGGLMPSISAAYVPLYFAFADSSVTIGNDGLVGGYTTSSTQGVVLELGDITFIDNLTHLFQLGYMMGTTDQSWVRSTSGVATENATFNPTFLTTADSILALNFISTYNIYENFSTTFGVGYMNMLTTNSHWRVKPEDNVLSLALGFQYTF
ncbi:MAG: outer membrane homotrimeric porin [Desulfovibrionaceae bacterium]|nr:outer membrane homotrimeric porin [Desulfovibrionaceae bacterium]